MRVSCAQEHCRRSDVVAEQEVEGRSRGLGDILQGEPVMGPASKDDMTQKAQGKHHVFRDGCGCVKKSTVKVVGVGLIVCLASVRCLSILLQVPWQ